MADYKHQNISPDALEDEARAPRQTSAFSEKNYLNVKLANGQDSKEIRIRLLPIDKDSNSPFKTVWMHTVQVSPEVSPKTPWKSYVCLNRTEDIDHETLGEKCPFCELNHIAYENMKEWTNKAEEAKKKGELSEESKCRLEADRWKKISLANKPSEVCVMRCIERGAEDDGPKFWKVTVRSDFKDPKNLIKKLFKDRWQESIDEAKADNNGELPKGFEPENILDVENGRDLKVTISRVYDKEGRPTDKTSISIVDYGKNKPLSPDPELIDKWINDDKVWSDVFVAKPYDYLSIIIDGGVPFYDKENKKWIPKIKNSEDQEKREEQKQEAEKRADKAIEAAKQKALSAAEDDTEPDETEELPF